MRYHRAVYFDDTLTIWARCGDLRGARFRYEYRIVRDGDSSPTATRATRRSTAETYRPTRVPDWLAEAIARAEVSSP